MDTGLPGFSPWSRHRFCGRSRVLLHRASRQVPSGRCSGHLEGISSLYVALCLDTREIRGPGDGPGHGDRGQDEHVPRTVHHGHDEDHGVQVHEGLVQDRVELGGDTHSQSRRISPGALLLGAVRDQDRVDATPGSSGGTLLLEHAREHYQGRKEGGV